MTVEQAILEMQRRFPFPGNLSTELRALDATYRSFASAVLRQLPVGSSILDFGCGSCEKTAILQFLGYRCVGYDDLRDDWCLIPGNREKIIEFARECAIDFRLAEGGPFPFEPLAFDMIMLNGVLEHLHDSPRVLLNDLLQLLKPSGLLFVTVPNAVNIRKRLDVLRGRTNLPSFEGYYWYPGAWRGHVREYVKDDLRRLVEYLGLELVELVAQDHMLEKVPAPARPIYLAVTAIFRGWKDSWLLVARKPANWTPRGALPREELDRLLERATSYRG